MAINSVNSADNSGQTYTVGSQQANPRQLFQQLETSLSNGDLKGAQQAYSAITQQFGGSKDSDGDHDGSGKAFSALGTALQAGNLSAAQQAFQTLKSHGGHHHGHKAQSANATTETGSSVASLNGATLNIAA